MFTRMLMCVCVDVCRCACSQAFTSKVSRVCVFLNNYVCVCVCVWGGGGEGGGGICSSFSCTMTLVAVNHVKCEHVHI